MLMSGKYIFTIWEYRHKANLNPENELNTEITVQDHLTVLLISMMTAKFETHRWQTWQFIPPGVSCRQLGQSVRDNNKINCFVDFFVEFTAHSTGARKGKRQPSVLHSEEKVLAFQRKKITRLIESFNYLCVSNLYSKCQLNWVILDCEHLLFHHCFLISNYKNLKYMNVPQSCCTKT